MYANKNHGNFYILLPLQAHHRPSRLQCLWTSMDSCARNTSSTQTQLIKWRCCCRQRLCVFLLPWLVFSPHNDLLIHCLRLLLAELLLFVVTNYINSLHLSVYCILVFSASLHAILNTWKEVEALMIIIISNNFVRLYHIISPSITAIANCITTKT